MLSTWLCHAPEHNPNAAFCGHPCPSGMYVVQTVAVLLMPIYAAGEGAQWSRQRQVLETIGIIGACLGTAALFPQYAEKIFAVTGEAVKQLQHCIPAVSADTVSQLRQLPAGPVRHTYRTVPAAGLPLLALCRGDRVSGLLQAPQLSA